jgi:hypothetical protein
MAGHALFPFLGQLGLFFHYFLVTVSTVLVGGAFIAVQTFGHLRTLVVTVFAFTDFLSFFVGNLLTVGGTVVTVSAFSYFLMRGVRKNGRLWLFGLVFFGLQDHVGRTFVGSNTDAGNTETGRYKQ